MIKRAVFHILIMSILLAAPALCAEVAVIAHPSVPVKTLTSAELLDVYSGDVREWQNGAPIVVMDLQANNSVRDAFYTYLGMSSSRMKSIWMKNMLSGEGRPPKAQPTGEDIIKAVMSTPGAIGYVDRRLVTGGVTELVIIEYQE